MSIKYGTKPRIMAVILDYSHIPYAERRCRRLVARGLLERDSDEVAYRLTADGRHYLSDSE